LIKFRNKQFPEKQQIDVSFSTENNEAVEAGVDFLAAGPRQIVIASLRTHMMLRIAHTDRTWGTDIEALLTGHLEMLRKPESGLRRLAYLHSGKIGLSVGILVFICALVAAYTVTNAFLERYLAAARTLAGKKEVDFAHIGQKIDFLIDVIASGMWTRYAVYVVGLFVVSTIVAVVCGAIVGGLAEGHRPSFVLLIKRAETDRTDAMRKYQKNWWKFVGSLIGSIVISVFGNYVFYKLMQLWGL
jgi:hypothetical protein